MPGNDNSKQTKQSHNIMDLPRISNPEPEEIQPINNQGLNNFNQQIMQPEAQAVNNNINQSQKPLVEIPDAYYEQLTKQTMEAAAKEQAALEQQLEVKETKKALGKTFLLSILTAIVTFVSLYLAINQNELFIFAIPIYVVVGAIITAIKNKQENSFPVILMIGGMIEAVLTFILSTLQEQQIDLWTTYAIAGAIVAFIGMITANVINKLIVERKNIKAIQTLGYILYFAVLVAVPYYLYNNYREEFYKFVFQKQVEVKAESEEDFVMKTLKNRYGSSMTFTCDSKKTKYQINQNKQKIVSRVCTDSYNNEFSVTSTAYNEGSNEYIVIDTYIDVLLLNNAKTTLSKELLTASGTQSVNVYLYPEKNCTFVGDCVDCEEYYARYEEETNSAKQYENSSMLNLEKYITLSTKDFINEYGFKIVVELTIQHNIVSTDYNSIIETVLNKLNSLGYKNTSGYIISIYEYDLAGDDLTSLAYKVTGTTNSAESFKDPIVAK